MRTAKHVALQKFEAIHMPLCGSITPWQRAGSANSGIVATNPEDLAGEFRHLALFRALEPFIKRLRPAFFQQGCEFLTQEVNHAEFIACLADMLNLMPLQCGQFLAWQNQQKGCTSRGKTTLTCRGCQTRFAWFPLSRFGRKFRSPLGDHTSE